MSNKFSTLALGAMLGLSTLAFSGASASAAAMLPLSPVVSGETNAASGGIVQVKHKKNHNNNWKWNNKYKNKCHRDGGCYHKHRRHHFDRSHLFLPLVIGGGFGGYNYYNDYDDYYGYDGYVDYDGGGLSSRHVRYCLDKYRSYNPRNNTWVSYSGRVKKCYSPYM